MPTDFDVKNRIKENPYTYLKELYPELTKELDNLQELDKKYELKKEIPNVVEHKKQPKKVLEVKETLAENDEEEEEVVGVGRGPDHHRTERNGKLPQHLKTHENEQKKDNSDRAGKKYIEGPGTPDWDTPADILLKRLEANPENYKADKLEVRTDILEYLHIFRVFEKSFNGGISLKLQQLAKAFNKKYPELEPIKFKVNKYTIKFPALKKENDYNITMDMDIEMGLDIPKVPTQKLTNFVKKVMKELEKAVGEGKGGEDGITKFEQFQKEFSNEPHKLLKFIRDHIKDADIEKLNNKLEGLDRYSFIESRAGTVVQRGYNRVKNNIDEFNAIMDISDYDKTPKSLNKDYDKIGIVFKDFPVLTSQQLIKGFTDVLVKNEGGSSSEGKQYKTPLDALKSIRMTLAQSLGTYSTTFNQLLESVPDDKYPEEAVTRYVTIENKDTMVYLINKVLEEKLGIKVLSKD